ncbi:uncharacterized protein KY384_005148 [Bacidia gigantensis]|uniref:uncharacterized protein n=1 Tax=Bacidia gigantensis TaxID=2732470 RepID=UPI001D03EDD5|nr:uncharacterized protein KY384_005148 [Bacidia gigantensis]KAG8529667.1 hypothetical protein KY384_005148 [Bacidia gigantensis]
MATLSPSEGNETQIADIWAHAAATYADTLGQRPAAQGRDLDSVDALLHQIDNQQSRFTEFREKRHTLFKVLNNLLKPVEFLCSLAGGGAQIAFPPSALVFSAVMYLIETGKGVSACYDAITTLFAELKDFTMRLKIHTTHTIPAELREVIVNIILSLLRIFDLSAKAIKRGRVKKYLTGLVLGKDEKVEAELKNLERLTQSEERIVGALTFSTVTQSSRTLDGINNNVGEMRSQLANMNVGIHADSIASWVPDLKGELKEERDRKLLEASLNSSHMPQEIFESISRKRMPNSGNWVREEPVFQAWVRDEISTIWLYGGPGAGKSFTSSNIVQHMTASFPQGVGDTRWTSVAYFFCKDYSQELRSVEQILRSLSFQICQNDPVYAKYCLSVFNSIGRIHTTEGIWRTLFIEFFQKEGLGNKAIILIDGLDEAYENEVPELLELLVDLHEEVDGKIRPRIQIALVGRPLLNQAIDSILGDNVASIFVSANKTSKDMNEYVKQSVGKVKILKRVSQSFRQEVEKNLMAGADGMFLWVDLMIKEISEKRRIDQIRQTLARLPRGLPDTIRHVLKRFADTSTEDTIADLNEILAWVACTKRHLTLGELDTFFKIQSADGEGLIDMEGDLRTRYASFFTITRVDGLTTEDLQSYHKEPTDLESLVPDDGVVCSTSTLINSDSNDGEDTKTEFQSDPHTTVVNFAHASIGEFFRQNSGGIVAGVGLEIHDARLKVTRACLNMWCNDDVWDALQENKFITSFAEDWMQYVEDIDLSAIELESKYEIQVLLKKTLREDKYIRRWLGLLIERFKEWYYSDASSSVIKKWFKDEDIHFASDADQSNSATITPSDTEVFRQVTEVAATAWLEDTLWASSRCVLLIWRYMDLTNQLTHKMDLPAFLARKDVGSTMVREIAEWAKRPKTALWHARLAEALEEFTNEEDAFKEYCKALQLDENLWLAHSGIANYEHRNERGDNAIKHMLKAQELILDDSRRETSLRDYLWHTCHQIASWAEENGNSKLALDSYKKALQVVPDEPGIIGGMLQVLDRQKNYEAVLGILKELDDKVSSKPGFSTFQLLLQDHLTCPLSYLYFLIARTARETDQREFIRKNLESTMKVARAKLRISDAAWIHYWLGHYILREFKDEVVAVRTWEAMIKSSKTSKSTSHLTYAVAQASIQLAVLYYNLALLSDQSSSEYDKTVRKIERLSQRRVLEDDGDSTEKPIFLFSTNDTTITLGSLYLLMKQEVLATACFKPHIKLGIDLLTDDDPANDWDAFDKLIATLLAAGHDDHAAAAFTTRWPVRKNKSDSRRENQGENPSPENELALSKAELPVASNIESNTATPTRIEEGFGELPEMEYDEWKVPGHWGCNGFCNDRESTRGTRHQCRICDGIEICDSCLILVKEDRRPFLLCNPKHDYFDVPHFKERLREDTVVYRGEEMEVSKWVEQLRRDWDV